MTFTACACRTLLLPWTASCPSCADIPIICCCQRRFNRTLMQKWLKCWCSAILLYGRNSETLLLRTGGRSQKLDSLTLSRAFLNAVGKRHHRLKQPTLSAPDVGFGPGKPVFLHLLDLGLQLDQLCCQKNADQVTLDWIKESGVTDLTNIPNNPAAYDAFLTSPLPFHFDDNVLLAVHTMDGVRKHLWFCVANQQLFWLIGCVPNMIETWRHKMLRRERYVSKIASCTLLRKFFVKQQHVLTKDTMFS